MESRKIVLMKLFAVRQWKQRHREQTYGQGSGRGRRGLDEWREQRGSISTTVCKIESQWKFAL